MIDDPSERRADMDREARMTNTSQEMQGLYDEYMKFNEEGANSGGINEKMAKKLAKKQKSQKKAAKNMGTEQECCRAD